MRGSSALASKWETMFSCLQAVPAATTNQLICAKFKHVTKNLKNLFQKQNENQPSFKGFPLPTMTSSWWNNLWNLRAPCAHSWAATEAHLDPCNFTTCRKSDSGLGKIYRKPMGNPWETYGKPMGNPWETHGNPWKPMLFSHLSGFPAPFPLNQFWREDLTICSWCSLSWHVITSAHQKGRNQIQRWSFWDAMSTQKILWFIIVPIKVGTNY